MARLATLLGEVRRESPNTVVVLGGDTLSPSVESTFLQGAQTIVVLDAIGLDYATSDTTSSISGPAVLVERMNESKFRWLSANVVDRGSGRPFGGASTDEVVTLGGLRIGLFGLTMADAGRTSRPGPRGTLSSTDRCSFAYPLIPTNPQSENRTARCGASGDAPCEHRKLALTRARVRRHPVVTRLSRAGADECRISRGDVRH